MKPDLAVMRRQAPILGDWELSIRGNRYSPFGIFLTTPRWRLWAFLRGLK